MPADQTILLVHAAATWYMTGLIWFVQKVHYPLFDRANRAEFTAFEAAHQARTTWVVAPAMIAEAITGVMLILRPSPSLNAAVAWAGMAMIVLLWLSTALLQVPQHRRLEGGYDARAHRMLVGTNWLRTALWTLRSVLVMWMLAAALG